MFLQIKLHFFQIYESCFGEEVVKQIRKEMKAACAKCAALETPPVVPQQRPTSPPLDDHQKIDTITEPENTIFSNQQSTFDADKLHQAILAFRPVNKKIAILLRWINFFFICRTQYHHFVRLMELQVIFLVIQHLIRVPCISATNNQRIQRHLTVYQCLIRLLLAVNALP